MLFWLMLILLAVGIVGIILTKNNWKLEVPNFFSLLITVIAVMALIVMLVIIMVNHIGADACVAANEEKYESIVYQYENDIYENDNDLGKRELMVDIEEWNTDLARRQEYQDNFWIGIFIPDIYDQFEFIEYK